MKTSKIIVILLLGLFLLVLGLTFATVEIVSQLKQIRVEDKQESLAAWLTEQRESEDAKRRARYNSVPKRPRSTTHSRESSIACDFEAGRDYGYEFEFVAGEGETAKTTTGKIAYRTSDHARDEFPAVRPGSILLDYTVIIGGDPTNPPANRECRTPVTGTVVMGRFGRVDYDSNGDCFPIPHLGESVGKLVMEEIRYQRTWTDHLPHSIEYTREQGLVKTMLVHRFKWTFDHQEDYHAKILKTIEIGSYKPYTPFSLNAKLSGYIIFDFREKVVSEIFLEGKSHHPDLEGEEPVPILFRCRLLPSFHISF